MQSSHQASSDGAVPFSVEGANKREAMLADSMTRLQNFAHRALTIHGLKNDQVVTVCIQVDDQPWRDIVDALTPGADWQEYRDRGEEPVARGTAMFSICEVLSERLPDLSKVLLETPPEGKVKAIVLGEGGCTVYEIEPLAAAKDLS